MKREILTEKLRKRVWKVSLHEFEKSSFIGFIAIWELIVTWLYLSCIKDGKWTVLLVIGVLCIVEYLCLIVNISALENILCDVNINHTCTSGVDHLAFHGFGINDLVVDNINCLCIVYVYKSTCIIIRCLIKKSILNNQYLNNRIIKIENTSSISAVVIFKCSQSHIQHGLDSIWLWNGRCWNNCTLFHCKIVLKIALFYQNFTLILDCNNSTYLCVVVVVLAIV